MARAASAACSGAQPPPSSLMKFPCLMETCSICSRRWGGACAAVVLSPPLAGVASPLAGLTILCYAVGAILKARRRTSKRGRRDWLDPNASGRMVRDLHLGAVWNVASLPNAFVAQACFVPLAIAEAEGHSHVVLLLLLPTCLLLTKFLSAQAYAALAASATVTEPVWAMLARCEEERLRLRAARTVALQPDSEVRGME